jgi:tRNA(Ile)-lysidine synthase TilS/MesJ
MGCSRCGRPGVIFQEYSGLHLCQQHFRQDLHHKAKKTVRKNLWLIPGTRYAIALSGGPASCALLDFMHTLVGERTDISLVAVTINHNDPVAMENAKAITESLGIPWFIVPDDNAEIQQGNRFCATNESPFPAHVSTECKLKHKAEQLKSEMLVLGYTLEDHAEWVLRNAISGNMRHKSGYATKTLKRVQIARPFMHIPGKELHLYTQIFLNGCYEKAENDTRLQDPVSTLLARLYSRHPGVPYALVNIGEQVKQFRDRVS